MLLLILVLLRVGPKGLQVVLFPFWAKVAIFPDDKLVVIITSTNYNTKGMHEQTDRLLTEYILPSLPRR